MVLWVVLNNITEIAVAGIKIKPRIAFRSLGSLIVLMSMFSICMNYLAEQIPPEIQLQNDLFYAANQDQNQTKEQWRAFVEKITHEMNTMAFAFIRIERPDPQSHDFTLKESSIQRLLKIALYWLPIAYLLLEVGQLG
jgi:excinuclease UvrABC ATPase subunit